MKTLYAGSNEMAGVAPASREGVGDWQRWAPYAAVAWSLLYGVMGAYWALGGRGFPFTPEAASMDMGPLAAQFGVGVTWVVVLLAGFPAAALGTAMLRGEHHQARRPHFIAAGVAVTGTLLLLMTSLDLLVKLGYVPYGVLRALTGSQPGRDYLASLVQWTTIHQLLCLAGGFLWLGATVRYARLSVGACLYCGRRDGPDGWRSPDRAARWGRVAVLVAIVPPVLYGLTRYAWALGIPLGMSMEYLREGQERGTWTSGLFLATFGLVGAGLMLGLVQRWSEVFPRWMLGLAGRRVPIALAVVPASLVSVLLVVGGVAIWGGLGQMAANLAASGVAGTDLVSALIIQVGPTLLFPVWGAALAVATLGYFYRRRGPCKECGRGAAGQIGTPRSAR